MKFSRLFLILIFLLSACSAPATRQTASMPQPMAAPATPAQPELRAAAAAGVVADLHTAADYATGYTPLKIKKNTQNKIQAIQDKHNKDLEQALK